MNIKLSQLFLIQTVYKNRYKIQILKIIPNQIYSINKIYQTINNLTNNLNKIEKKFKYLQLKEKIN